MNFQVYSVTGLTVYGSGTYRMYSTEVAVYVQYRKAGIQKYVFKFSISVSVCTWKCKDTRKNSTAKLLFRLWLGIFFLFVMSSLLYDYVHIGYIALYLYMPSDYMLLYCDKVGRKNIDPFFILFLYSIFIPSVFTPNVVEKLLYTGCVITKFCYYKISRKNTLLTYK